MVTNFDHYVLFTGNYLFYQKPGNFYFCWFVNYKKPF